MSRINVKLDALEAMLYFWKATSEKEKVGEAYIADITQFDEMKPIYTENFTPEVAQKVLSAISNREILNTTSKTARKFWNNNMWMMEDLEYTDMMVAPLKTLNLDDMAQDLGEAQAVDVVFVPGHHDVAYVSPGKVTINFFRVKPDLMDPDVVTIEDIPLKKYITEKIREAL